MIANGTHQSNGSNGHYLNCASDYEERQLIDVTPKVPRPGWKDAFPTYTHNLTWQDADGLSHSMTLRSDDLYGLMSDLKMLKGMIRQAKQKASEHAPQQAATPEPDSDIPPCKIHGTPMVRKVSKRTQGIYFSHKMASGELCFGRERKA